MNIRRVVCSIPLVFLLVNYVNAAENKGTYVEVNLLQLDTAIGTNDASPTAVRGKFGKTITNHFAVEGIIALGLGEDDVTANEQAALKNMYGINLHGTLQAAKSTELFFNLGLTAINMEIGNVSEDDTGLSFGAGVAYAIGRDGAITFEYSQLPDINRGGTDPDLENTAISLGYRVSL